MHLLLCLASVLCAFLWRWLGGRFLVSPFLLFSTTIVVLRMGWEGEMWMIAVGWAGFVWALIFLFWGIIKLVWDGVDLYRSVQKVKRLPLKNDQIRGREITYRWLDQDFPFAGLVGFINPQLVLSRGLMELLDQEHLEAVICHEEAHRFYGDCFWFFWLGYLKRLTFYLPRSEALWQQLLLEREIRADRKAAETIDPLCIAESLVQIIDRGNGLILTGAIPFFEPRRLEQRIEALLSPPVRRWYGGEILFSILVSLLPLFYLPCHR